MDNQALRLWTILKLLALGCAASYDNFAFPIDQSLVHNYSRLAEINKHCSSYISLASKLEYDDINAISLKNELSFFNGDWEQQDSHGATLMPFDDTDMPRAASSFIHPWKVVSFQVRNASSNEHNQPKNTVSISAVLSIGITRNSTLIPEPGIQFHRAPGMSALRVDFEGLYLETKDNEGERLLCMLGDSTFPFKKVPTNFTDEYMEYMELYFSASDTIYNEEPVIVPHDKILLIVRYPKIVSLVNNHIHGEMTSLNDINDFEYFDKVHISSRSGVIPEYHIGTSTEQKVVESFDQNPLKDAVLEDGVNKFNNTELCRILKYFEHEEYKVEPTLKLGGQNWFQDTVGPFRLGNEILLSERNNQNLRIIMHNINCDEDEISGVLRMYPATLAPHVAACRTGLSTLTLSVSGTWNSSTGLLSMTGCLGPTLVECDSGVLLYFPKSFSSKQRSVVSGSVFSLKNATKTFLPVFFGLEMLSPGLHDGGWYSKTYLLYNYSKNGLANEFKERIQEPEEITSIRKSVFQYPNPVADDLKIDTFSSAETFVKVEVLSLGPLFRTNDSNYYEIYDHDVVNISLNLLLIENPNKVYLKSYHHVSKLYLEGVYDRDVGIMYLIGCRRVDFDHVDLERGLDCLLEVTIAYSSLNTRWLVNPTATITIRSQRHEEDTYQFKPIRLHTYMLHDKNHEQNVGFRKIFEGYFRVFIVLWYIAHILKQIKYMKSSLEPVAACISLVTPGLWIVGYGVTLIYSKEFVVISSEMTHYAKQPYALQNYKQHIKILDYFARFLVLVSMFLMAWISRMVLKARQLLREQGESSPSERKVFRVWLVAYICYFLLRFTDGGVKIYLTNEISITKYFLMNYVVELFRYTLCDVQDYILCAQILALWVWKPRHQGIYYFIRGLWFVSLFQFLYEVVRDPVSYPV